MRDIFNKDKLSLKVLKKLYSKFWYSPVDAFLRSPEVAIWSSIIPKHPVMTIGCADGRMDKFLFPHIVFDVGIDNNCEAVKVAGKTGMYKKVLCTGAENLSFKSGSFSAVVSNSTFEHIKKDVESVSEVSRVLKKGGDFIFTTTTDRYEKQMEKMGVTGEKLKKYNLRVEHFHYRSFEEWKNILKKHGFEIVYSRYYFPEKCMRIWWMLHRLTTFKVHHRELWSYLKDSPYGKLFPKKLMANLYFMLTRNAYKKAFDTKGCWLFIWAKKK